MLIERWQPLRQAPDEGTPGIETPETPEAPPPSGPGSGRSELRQQLEKNFETDRKSTEKREAAAKGKPKAPRRVAGGAEIEPATAPEGAAEAAEAPVEGEGTPEGQQAAVQAPEGFSAEAKAAWAETPPTVQAAIVKREADMTKGVEDLKNKYKELDSAIAPHMEAIRRVNQTPAKAVEQLFAWFQALSANPKVAFPALLQSFQQKPEDIFGPGVAQGQAQPGQPVQPAAEAQPAGDVPPAVQKYINEMQAKLEQFNQAFTQKFGNLEQTFAAQSQAKTDEQLALWSKDKPHFEAVRQLMANLIASNAVPLKNGQVDLDRAYEMAIYADPTVRTQVLTAQQEAAKKAAVAKAAAEKKAQQEAADKARKTAVSVSGAAPGAPGTPGKPTGKRKTVRESLNEAMEQLQE